MGVGICIKLGGCLTLRTRLGSWVSRIIDTMYAGFDSLRVGRWCGTAAMAQRNYINSKWSNYHVMSTIVYCLVVVSPSESSLTLCQSVCLHISWLQMELISTTLALLRMPFIQFHSIPFHYIPLPYSISSFHFIPFTFYKSVYICQNRKLFELN